MAMPPRSKNDPVKIYIMVDLEGSSGISGEHYNTAGPLNELGKRFMADDVNACIEGCCRTGATEILVKDAHGGGFNLTRDVVDSRADLIDGDTPRMRFADIEGSAGLILLGYHAMAGTLGAVLDHTFSPGFIQNIWLNGKKAGEIAIDAAIAAEHGVPTIMVSGDDKTCLEARDWIPGVITCETKKGYSKNGARLMALDKAHHLIEARTIEAVKKCATIPLLELRRPVALRRELADQKRLPEHPDHKYIDNRTYETVGQSVEALMFFNY